MSSGPSHLGSARGASRSGCLIALYVVLGLAVLILLAGGLGVWVFLRSETGQKVWRTVTAGVTLTREATRAPGTDALRAGGCSQALVVPTGRVVELLGEFVPEVRTGGRDAGAFGEQTVVLCQVDTGDAMPPDCAEVARVYAGAAPAAPERFGVVVQVRGQRNAVCQGSYARDGSFLDPPEPE
jgi:hypothetical protein